MTIITDYTFIFKEIPAVPAHYQTAIHMPTSLAIDNNKETLTTRGIILGAIRESVDPFIGSLTNAWEDSTKSMLQVSHCKSMMESLPPRPNPYQSIAGRHNSSWRTILADHEESQDYHPDLTGFNEWLSPIPVSWNSVAPHILQIRSGRQWQVRVQAMLLQYNFADFLKRGDREIADRVWSTYVPKAGETPPRGMTPEGEKDLMIDNTYDPM